MQKNDSYLSALLKTIQAAQTEIRSSLESPMCSNLRNMLENQLKEFDSIETEAYTIALQRGWELQELNPVKRFVKDKITRIKLKTGASDSKIAGMLIKQNTKDMIHGIKNLHQCDNLDHHLHILSQKLLDCETAHIHHMQHFL